MENPELNNSFTTSLVNIKLIKDDVEFSILPWLYKGISPFESLSFIESINSTNIGGNLLIKDVYNWSEELNVHSFSKLEIELIKKKPSEDSSIEKIKLSFNVIGVSQVTNRPISLLMNNVQTYTIIRFDFTSEDIFSSDLDNTMFQNGSDFVGFIASDDDSEISGLVNEIFKKLNVDNYEIEPTYNGVWIRSNELSYPWAKDKGQMNVASLMQYICNYAVSKNNPNAVNYFFWRDREGYKFKSIEKLISEQEDVEHEKINFSDSAEVVNQVKTITQMHEPNVLMLAKNNVFQTYYEKITPNYDDYYLDFVDTSLSYKRQIVDLDYQRDHILWKKIEKYKIIPDNENTSVRNPDLIQSVKTDDAIYGYFDNKKLNTPFPQSWDHIGKTMDSRWNDISFIPQYDITDLDLETFYTIHKKIREPLKQKRSEYAYLKNLKRKWEVYRCSVCCLEDRLGGIQDQIDIENLQGIENPNTSKDYLTLFGPTGIFGESSTEYKIVAAGSFSDVYNYDSSQEKNRGLTLSYDMSSSPFNESIGQFYYFKNNFEEYEKYVLDAGVKIYDMYIEKNNQRLKIIDEWLQSVDGYIQSANQLYDSVLTPISCTNTGSDECGDFKCESPSDGTYAVDARRFNNYENDQCFYFERSLPIEFIPERENETAYYQFSPLIGSWLFECSLQKFVSQILSYNFENKCSPNTSLRRVASSSFNYYYGNTEGLGFTPVSEEYQELKEKEIQDIIDRKAYCPLCLNPISLQISKKYATNQKAVLEAENRLWILLKESVRDNFIPKWKEAKENYFNRKAFFISKEEPKVKNNVENVNFSNLSLLNVKSVKRKSIRGSRYEILAHKSGITGEGIGAYLYNIFFDGLTADISVEGNHPYYDQTFTDKLEGSHLSLPKPKKVKRIDDTLPINDPDSSIGWRYGPKPEDVINDSKLSAYIETEDGDYIGEGIEDKGYSNTIIRKLNNNGGVESYENRYKFTEDILTGKKPPNLKREEISSYVRIEFNNPIGLESLADFPDGFIRNAGYEYFLPYIVSLTSGPNGRQTIKQNVVIIGMDPYGFDVAMKRINDSNDNGEYYWWSTNLPVGEICLWPEMAFETKYTYYSEYLPKEKYFKSLNDMIGLNTSTDNYTDGKTISSTESCNYSSSDTLINFDGFNNYGNNASQPNDNFNGYGEVDSTNPLLNAKYDDELHETMNASGLLLNSHKVLKAHRSWWSFHIADNLLIIPKFTSILNTAGTDLVGNNWGVAFVNRHYRGNNFIKFDTFGWMDNSYRYRKDFLSKIYEHSEYKSVLKLENNINVYELLEPIINQDISFFYPEHQSHPVLSVHKDLELVNPALKKYFSDITHYWMNGDHIIYRQPLQTSEVWKYDLSGYSEYGMSFPPVRHNHGDIFDNNFAAQFVVFAKTSDSICKRNNLKCINPNGSVYSQGCPPDNPYCNCPAQNRKPTEPEPSYLALYKLEQEIKECSLIQQHLGSDWLGCVWSNPTSTGSCNCPEVGERFMDYLEYNRTYAAFWSTPAKTPLLRNTQYNLLFAQTVQVHIARNDNIKIGSIVSLEDLSEFSTEKYRRFGGKWIVTEITNLFYANKDFMSVTLNRDSLSKDINDTNLPGTATE
jgi:hypothetical protein